MIWSCYQRHFSAQRTSRWVNRDQASEGVCSSVHYSTRKSHAGSESPAHITLPLKRKRPTDCSSRSNHIRRAKYCNGFSVGEAMSACWSQRNSASGWPRRHRRCCKITGKAEIHFATDILLSLSQVIVLL